MTTKHTPGPWYLASTDNGAQAHLQTSARETDTYIALIDTMDAEQDANARLLRAAPALAAALAALRDASTVVLTEWDGGDLAGAVRELDAAAEEATRALEGTAE
tara:strand:+ start:953 stop:1264 length:312 start_codon:yes stop_codon:yes gene_type:complete